jgi:hypothetical protein
MNTMKNFLSMAALALMGAMMTGCSSDDNFDNPQQPENASKVVTLTTTVGFGASASNRALTIDGTKGVKTFAVDDQIAVVYKKKTGGATAVAVSEKLTTTDIASGSKSATFTVTLDDPDKDQNVTYIYPAAMAKADGSVNYDALATQDGTLATLGSTLDLCTNSGAWSSDNLPSLALENQLAILAISLKNTTDITSTITGMTVSDGTNTYTVSRSAAAGPIYVAIQPVTSQNIEVTATDGTDEYVKSLSGKTYAANYGYNVTWNMSKLTKVTWNSTNVFNDSHQDDKLDKWHMTPRTYEGITISFNGSGAASGFYAYDEGMGKASLECFGAQGGVFTFTAPSGKHFYKVEIIDNSDVTFTKYGDWTKPVNNKIVWRGTPASTVTLGGSYSTQADDLNSIVFTVN